MLPLMDYQIGMLTYFFESKNSSHGQQILVCLPLFGCLDFLILNHFLLRLCKVQREKTSYLLIKCLLSAKLPKRYILYSKLNNCNFVLNNFLYILLKKMLQNKNLIQSNTILKQKRIVTYFTH